MRRCPTAGLGGVRRYPLPTRLAALRAEGRPAFVNMTAAWCVTCLVNERVAISSDPVRQAFADTGYAGSVIVELKGGDEAYLRDVSSRVDRLLLNA